MADIPGYVRACLQTGKLAFLAILVSGGIVLQILACALYDNWWPMLTAIMYVLLPMPLLFFAGSDTSSLVTESSSGIAIPAILKHAGVIGWGALGMQMGSYLIFVIAMVCYIQMNDDGDGYSSFWHVIVSCLLSINFEVQCGFSPSNRSFGSLPHSSTS
ncbi:hypothetical protein RHMOL_Rhmol01G0122100 [Rhododendron molle]|uniref:Uncharacterized protein n=1 Tax=Rhododendron molle TaxID=49168 RepID=A0ACC0Q0V9_RHOML|nr:hypothetical protein RHMOL_Rhmol01G0122100 [Rhododendron molle]